MSEASTPESGQSLDQSKNSPVLTLDGTPYAFSALSDRARWLGLDYVRTNQEWSALIHRYRQFMAMESTVVNQLKLAVESSEMQPLWTSGETPSTDIPVLTIDSRAYDATQIPAQVRQYVEDLVRNNRERGQLEFRLRQLDAARTAYLDAIRKEIAECGVAPLEQVQQQEEQGGHSA